jgi:hypothetical protein
MLMLYYLQHYLNYHCIYHLIHYNNLIIRHNFNMSLEPYSSHTCTRQNTPPYVPY